MLGESFCIYCFRHHEQFNLVFEIRQPRSSSRYYSTIDNDTTKIVFSSVFNTIIYKKNRQSFGCVLFCTGRTCVDVRRGKRIRSQHRIAGRVVEFNAIVERFVQDVRPLGERYVSVRSTQRG